MSSRMGWSLLGSLAILVGVSGCKYETPEPFTESQIFAGTEVSAYDLNRGREDYVLYCYACHGMEGDGQGPARQPRRRQAQSQIRPRWPRLDR